MVKEPARIVFIVATIPLKLNFSTILMPVNTLEPKKRPLVTFLYFIKLLIMLFDCAFLTFFLLIF